MEYLIVPVFFLIALSLFWASLKFSKYKQGQSACCGGANCSTDPSKKKNGGSCYKEKADFVEEFGTKQHPSADKFGKITA